MSEIVSENRLLFFFSLVIRGDKEERAVLCSGDKTYDLKIADTSNVLLFVPGCKTSEQMTDSSQNGHHIFHTQVCESPPLIIILVNVSVCGQQLTCIYYWYVFISV